jgi:hypothetical protein
MDGSAGSLLNNPAVIGGGIGGIISVLLIGVMYRGFLRVGDAITQFTEGQATSSRMVAKSISDAFERMHDDNIAMIRAFDQISAKLDVLLDRTSRTFEQVAIHRGVSEPPLVGAPPAIIQPQASEKNR